MEFSAAVYSTCLHDQNLGRVTAAFAAITKPVFFKRAALVFNKGFYTLHTGSRISLA
jgi:hypothetical protein